MKKTLNNYDGFYAGNTLGISGNQCGYDLRIMMLAKFPGKLGLKLMDTLINPKIISLSEEESTIWEGCISDDKYY
jgi:peptide deformylase